MTPSQCEVHASLACLLNSPGPALMIGCKYEGPFNEELLLPSPLLL